VLRELLATLRAQVLTFAGTTAVLLLLWWAVTSLGWANPAIFPSLGDIASATTSLSDASDDTFLDHLWATTGRVLLALASGCALGFLMGILFWRVPVIGRAVEPYLISFYAVPLVVFYPFLLVLMGINSWPIIVLSGIMCAIPVALNTWIGFRDQPEIFQRVARVLQMSPLLRFRRIEAPAAMPHVFIGARVGVVYSLVGTIGMEFMVSGRGLGYAIRFQYETFDVPSMYLFLAATLVLSFVVVTVLLAASAITLRHNQ
jgi:NitT/TauT family transport system permease protein